jgi:HamA
VLAQAEEIQLAKYISSKAPLFYRNLSNIVADMSDSRHFGSVIKETLSRIPSDESFRESHFCEIVSGVFAEEVMGLTRIYSKLTLLTAENANAYKMDLVLCRPDANPVEFVFGEVKSSCKQTKPANHHKSCFADLFVSFNGYDSGDMEFDLTSARDRVEALLTQQRDKVRKALLPYGDRILSYAGFVVIDSSTFDHDESKVLATRKNNKAFDIELLCVDTLKDTGYLTYSILETQLKAF